MGVEQKIKALRELMEARLSQIDSREKLAAFWQDVLGKKGSVAELMKGLGAVAKEDRPAMGKVINELKVQAEQRYQEYSERMESWRWRPEPDGTGGYHAARKKQPTGNLHPIDPGERMR